MQRARATRDEAMRLISALIAREFAGPLPELATEETVLDSRAHLEQFPLVETLALHGRALFASAGLTPEARQHAAWARERFFEELGAPFELSARETLAAVRMRKFPLVPPRKLAGYEYLGTFRCGGRVDLADPCLLRKTSRLPAEVFALSYAIAVRAGTWHVFVRPGEGDAAGRTAELAVIHDDGFDIVATMGVVTIGVDGGMAGVFDSECPVPETVELQVEGVCHGLGAFARSGWGDGMYPVYAGKAQGEVVKLRIGFLDERPEIDATMPKRDTKRYMASATFAVGDVIEHVKFGVGMVLRAVDGKIVVQFEDEDRTLVHAKR